MSDKKVIFVTNDSKKSRRTLQKKFAKIGVDAHLVCHAPRLMMSNDDITL